MFDVKNLFKKKNREEKRKILLIEDDALLIKVLVSEITSAGYDVISVENGLEALDTAKKIMPDVILLDLILPGLDGFEILKQIRNDKELGKTPVFVVSNLDSVSDVKSAKALDADEYFIKANTEIDSIIKAIKKKLEK